MFFSSKITITRHSYRFFYLSTWWFYYTEEISLKTKKENRLLFHFTICSLQPFHVIELYIHTHIYIYVVSFIFRIRWLPSLNKELKMSLWRVKHWWNGNTVIRSLLLKFFPFEQEHKFKRSYARNRRALKRA